MDKDEQELLNFSKRWDESMVSNDANEIAKFMSDDWMIVGSNGMTNKSTFLNWISSGEVSHSKMDSDETNITIYGSTGILIARGTSAGKFNGNDFSLYEWSTSVFIKANGEWRCVLTMLAPALADGLKTE